jgi:hypothetical protein
VHTAEALAWLSANPSRAGMSIATSMPDISETPHLTLAAWKAWFTGAASQIFDWLPPHGMAIFYQSDIRHEGIWIDKGYLVQRAAEDRAVHLVWHKIACRKPPGTLGLGRPSYAHLLCFSKHRAFALREPGPDVLPDAGPMSFSRATGAEAARVACAYLRASTQTDTVVDPFCGEGTMLAAANAEGLAAVGIDLNEKRVSKARRLTL